MKIELMDQPILIVKTAPPAPVSAESQRETLEQIESLLEDEIVQIRDQLKTGASFALNEYFTDFNLHLQTDNEVVSVVLESEWQEQNEEGIVDTGEADEQSDLIDLEVSKLMRVVKVTFESKESAEAERKKLLRWVAAQQTPISIVSGIGSSDYLLISARDILNSINNLRENL